MSGPSASAIVGALFIYYAPEVLRHSLVLSVQGDRREQHRATAGHAGPSTPDWTAAAARESSRTAPLARHGSIASPANAGRLSGRVALARERAAVPMPRCRESRVLTPALSSTTWPADRDCMRCGVLRFVVQYPLPRLALAISAGPRAGFGMVRAPPRECHTRCGPHDGASAGRVRRPSLARRRSYRPGGLLLTFVP